MQTETLQMPATAPRLRVADDPNVPDAVDTARDVPVTVSLSDEVRRTLEPLLLSAEDLARLLSVSKATVWRMRALGRLPRPVGLGPQTLRWRAEEIRAWTAAGCPDLKMWEAMKK